MHSQNFQTKVMQSQGWLSALWCVQDLCKRLVLRTCARCMGLDLCCGQDGYRAQVLQHPVDSYRYIQFKFPICMYNIPAKIKSKRLRCVKKIYLPDKKHFDGSYFSFLQRPISVLAYFFCCKTIIQMVCQQVCLSAECATQKVRLIIINQSVQPLHRVQALQVPIPTGCYPCEACLAFT